MTLDYRIKHYEKSDAEEVSQLIAKTLRTSNSKDLFCGLHRERCKELLAGRRGRKGEGMHVYVTSDGTRIVGCGAIGPFWGKQDESALCSIFVLPEYQGQGVGRSIVETLEQDELFLRARRVEVASSITACEFYRRMDYEFKGDVKTIDEEQLIRMEKTLDRPSSEDNGSANLDCTNPISNIGRLK